MLTQKEELECAIKEVIAEMYNVVSGYPYGVCPKTCMVSEKECNAQGGQDADTCRACWRLYTRTLYERIINIYDQMERKKGVKMRTTRVSGAAFSRPLDPLVMRTLEVVP